MMLFFLAHILPSICTSDEALEYFDRLFKQRPFIFQQLKDEMDEEDIRRFVKFRCGGLPLLQVEVVVENLLKR